MSPLLGVTRQEHEAAAVVLGRRQGDAQAGALTAEELVRHLDQDAGAVAGVRLAAAGAAMEQVDQDRSAWRTIVCERRPLMSTTNPTPQASCSWLGS